MPIPQSLPWWCSKGGGVLNNSEIRYSDIEPLCLVRAVLRNIWMVFAAALCGLFGAYLVLTSFYKPQYSGSATFVVMAKS